MNTPSTTAWWPDVGAGERVAVGLGPVDVVGEGAEGGGDVALREARVRPFDDLSVRGHLETPSV